MERQARINVLFAAQGSPFEDHLLHMPIIGVTPLVGPDAGRNQVDLVTLGDGSQAYFKSFRGVNVAVAGYYGHHPDETPIQEAVAWRLAYVLGGPVADIVAPCVLRTVEDHAGALSAKRLGINDAFAVLEEARKQCLAAAFFDSLIAQQDRHRGNYRWHKRRWTRLLPSRSVRALETRLRGGRQPALGLGLIDHGFAFARPGKAREDVCWETEFVRWRWERNEQALRRWERKALERLLASTDLHGIAIYLEADRALALARRARLMLENRAILKPGQW
jgi:hypothetical protein